MKERHYWQRSRIVVYALLITVVTVSAVTSIELVPRAHADSPYTLNSVPAFAQEGNAISLVLTVKFNPITTSTTFEFRFNVKDPAGRTFQSHLINYTTAPGQDQFSVIVAYPGVLFPGSNSLAGQYAASVDQVAPSAMLNVASSSFVLAITDNPSYERTQTVNLQGSGYNPSESVAVTIRTQTTSSLVFSQTILATSGGIVTGSWKIPVSQIDLSED